MTKIFYIPLETIQGYPDTKITVIDAWTNDGRVIPLNRYIDAQNMRAVVDCRNVSGTTAESFTVTVRAMYTKQ